VAERPGVLRLRQGPIMPIKSLLSEMSVDVTKTEMICKAFDDAWAHLKNADDTLADPS
jgi:hypothetical protein